MVHQTLTHGIMGYMENSKVGILLQEYRRKKYLSVRQAAEAIGIHYTYLSRIENGISEPSEEVLEKISSYYELTKDERAELFLASKISDTVSDIITQLGKKKAAEIMFRMSKKKDRK